MNNGIKLGDRMKQNYENRAKTYLTRRTPVIIRVDGKAFHTLTRHLKKPYDEIFHQAMNSTMEYLCKNIQGCKIGYTQSDEITLLLTDYDTLTTDAWFDYAVEKMCSVSASMATFAFNKYFADYANKYINTHSEDDYTFTLHKVMDNGGMFDARCFNIPENEIVNCFIWRQNDATRNAIQMLARSYFSDRELANKNNDVIQDMLMVQKHVNFNDMPVEFKRGVCAYRNEHGWYIDKDIPVFTQDKNFIADRVKTDAGI